MSGRGRGTKRKSEDFIYEVDDKDLSTDEEENVKKPCFKISKLEDDSIETSRTKQILKIDNIKDESIEDHSSKVDTKEDKKTVLAKEESTDEKPQSDKNIKGFDDAEVIEIDDSITDQNNSVMIIEEPVSILVLSDDENKEEEGEIIEDLVVVDEVNATPLQKSSKNESNKKENQLQTLDEVDEEFHIIEEIGPSPRATEKKNLINISFSCEKTMNDYGHLLVKFLKSFPEIETTTEKLCIKVHEKEIFSESRTPKKKNKKKKPKKDLFVVDTNPSSKHEDNYPSLVRYTSKFTIEEEGEAESAPTGGRSGQTCFNCGGEHALRDCSAPRNHQRINQARQQFLDRNKTVRYHGEQNQKLQDFKPGVISENLRNALGLRPNEVPNHIYRMRQLGYPPGWLEEAKVLPSDLNMFNIDGKKVEHGKRNTISIDPDKVVEYPGFNVPLKKGFYDDFRRHNVKPYNKSMHKSGMIKYYEDLYQNEITIESGSDMDISDVKTPQKKCIETAVKDRASVSVNSPSLVDLEEKKKQLMDQLKAGDDDDKVEPSTDDDDKEKSSINDEDDREKSSINDDEEKNNSSIEDVEENSSEVKTEETSIKEDHITAVKNTSLGTPILKSSSPYSRLPNPDNFSVGVSPVIDFENLPNSTGKYEELSKVLSKVRMTMKNKF